MTLDRSLLPQQAELRRLNFQFLRAETTTIIAGRHSFHWDCIFTFITYTVFVKRVATLSAQMVEGDRPKFLSEAKSLNPSWLPRGLQAGDAVLVVYIADWVDVDAQLLCKNPAP